MTQHFIERFRDRVLSLPLPRPELEKLLHHILDLSKTISGEVSIMVKQFEDDIIRQDHIPHRRVEDQLWVILRNGNLVTTHRRSSNDTRYTNPTSMKVDQLIYQPI
ncbi:hypothetical protein N8735_00050 [Candidatus Marinimicrobia bacterium]|jgi:hypothetical protein|nr:hypothetical protein [Candidatus Neomarinimicrobiota bacterium]|tara:strand:+ start:900 stop:1217 length:318 start_codon:yes stop_codon:yes gene_type:complete